DRTDGIPAILESFDLPGSIRRFAEAQYDAGAGNAVASVYYEYATTNVAAHATDANWLITVAVDDQDTFVNPQTSGDLHQSVGTSGSGTFTATTPQRYASLQFRYEATTSAPGVERVCHWRRVAVFGDHGLA